MKGVHRDMGGGAGSAASTGPNARAPLPARPAGPVAPARLPTRTFAVAGMAALAVPTLLSVAREHWSTREGTQGPIILVTGMWLLWRVRSELQREASPLAGASWPVVLSLLALAHAAARLCGILSLETAITYLMGLMVALVYLGPALIRRYWFPFAYMAFLIVPPASAMAELTRPLQIRLSAVSVDLLLALGYPVALSGVTIQIGQYELLVRQACAGLGSLMTLCAVGLFYVHLRGNAGMRYGLLLLAAVVPVAVFANLVRIVMVVLLTWYGGSAIGQGVAHEFAGLLMLCVAMLCLVAVDRSLGSIGAGRADG